MNREEVKKIVEPNMNNLQRMIRIADMATKGASVKSCLDLIMEVSTGTFEPKEDEEENKGKQ